MLFAFFNPPVSTRETFTVFPAHTVLIQPENDKWRAIGGTALCRFSIGSADKD